MGISQSGGGPALRLHPARPNPTTAGAALAFTLPADGPALVRLFSVDGRLVRTLVDAPLPAGTHRIDWDGRTQSGRAAAPGIYFATLRAAGDEKIAKLVLIE